MPTFDFRILIAVGMSFLLFTGVSDARPIPQDDNPFGAFDDVIGDDPQPTASKPVDTSDAPPVSLSISESSRLIIRSIRASNPQTPVELSKAVKTLMDIEVYDQARYYLSKLKDSAPNDLQLFELQTEVGSDFFLMLHGNAEMQPEGAEFASMVFEAGKRAAFNPKRVSAIVRALSSNNVSTRSEAFRMIRRLGAPGAAALLNVFTDRDRVKEFVFVRSALRHFGKSAIGPLVGASRANHLQMQVEAVRALGYYKTSDSADSMYRVYLSPRFPESVRRNALDSMMTQFGQSVNPGEIEQRLYKHAQEYLLGKRKIPGTANGEVTVWRFNDDSQQLEARVVAKLTAERMAAADRAQDLFEINSTAPQNRSLYLLTQLESAKRLAGPGVEIDIKKDLQRFGTLDPFEVQQALRRALELELVPAAIGACETLEQIGSPFLLTSNNNGQNSPLIQAILTGNRHLQFAALKAINAIDPKQAFPGSSYISELAVYLARSQGIGAGLVGHSMPSIAQSYAAAINNTGLYGRSVESSREFFKQAVSNPDFAVLLITDSLSRPDYVELAQQLRNDWRTRLIPIGMMVRDDRYGRRINRIIRKDPLVMVLPGVIEERTVSNHVGRLIGKTEPWPVRNEDRRKHAALAVDWLSKVAANRADYPFWDLPSYQDDLVKMLFQPGYAFQVGGVLSAIGTPSAQRALVDFASQSGLPLEDRQAAAEAFASSVKRAGVLLTSGEIQRQYDRYNASENDERSTQRLLNNILDAIESHGAGQVSSSN